MYTSELIKYLKRHKKRMVIAQSFSLLEIITNHR